MNIFSQATRRQLYQCRLQNILKKSIIKDVKVNYLRGQRRTVLPDLQDKNRRCSAGMVEMGRREGRLLPHSPLSLRVLDRLQTFRTLREKDQTPFIFSYTEWSLCSFILCKIETTEKYCTQEAYVAPLKLLQVASPSRCLYTPNTQTYRLPLKPASEAAFPSFIQVTFSESLWLFTPI